MDADAGGDLRQGEEGFMKFGLVILALAVTCQGSSPSSSPEADSNAAQKPVAAEEQPESKLIIVRNSHTPQVVEVMSLGER